MVFLTHRGIFGLCLDSERFLSCMLFLCAVQIPLAVEGRYSEVGQFPISACQRRVVIIAGCISQQSIRMVGVLSPNKSFEYAHAGPDALTRAAQFKR
jgi:hypothetical protein